MFKFYSLVICSSVFVEFGTYLTPFFSFACYSLYFFASLSCC